MTTMVKVNTNGNYVAMVKINGEDQGLVGPGSSVERTFGIFHGKVNTFTVEERPATDEEIAAERARVMVGGK